MKKKEPSNGEQLATSTTGSACFNVKEIERTLLMAIEASFGFYILLIQQILLRPSNADDLCYYLNQSSIIVPIRCPSDCCPGTATSPTTACCSQMSWSSFVVPIFVIGGVCLLAVCLVYIRPLLKLCFCGCRCPFGHRSRVSSSGIQSATNIPPTVMNNTDLPDYETVHKAPAPKDITPPPYNFVTAHPSDYGLEASFPSAPPQYRSRDNSAGSVRFHTRAES